MVLQGPYVRQTLPRDQQDSVRGEIIAILDISFGTQEKTVPPRTASQDGVPLESTHRERLLAIEAPTGGFRPELNAEKMKKAVWLKPEAVAQIEFLEWTGADRLRHSKFVALREDKNPRSVIKEDVKQSLYGDG